MCGEEGPLISNSNKKHFTKRDQHLYLLESWPLVKDIEEFKQKLKSQKIDSRWNCKYYSLFDLKIYKTTYQKIKSKYGNMILGINNFTFNN
jgi:hypothetical protein